jgi:hypothetical protein
MLNAFLLQKHVSDSESFELQVRMENSRKINVFIPIHTWASLKEGGKRTRNSN